MLNVADFLVAAFIFLLFLSIYRKRNSTVVRFWTVGWCFVLLHFGALLFHPSGPAGQTAQSLVALSTLVLCATSFALSYPASHVTVQRQVVVGGLLGFPWLLVMILGSLPGNFYLTILYSALLSAACMVGVAVCFFEFKPVRLCFTMVLIAGCGAWMISSVQAHDADRVQLAVLTLCFGLNAVLLSGKKLRFSTASLTTSIGAVCWGGVWVNATLVGRFAPHLALSPEIWNLPKYMLAAGMVLSLLEEEILSTELASEQYRLLFAGNPHPMWIYDRDTLGFLEVNEAAVAHYGYSRPEFQAMTLLDIMQTPDECEAIGELRSAQPQLLTGPWLHRRKDGTEFQVDVASQPLRREGQQATFALMHDVTEPQRLQSQLIRQAHHDPLTGLPNRTFFEHIMTDVLEEAQLQQQRAAVLCIDLDRFKQINDTFGHGAGDSCLRELSHRITARLGRQGTLARTGGDEFMLVLANVEKAVGAEEFATRLLADLKPSVALEGGEVEIAASIGIALFPDDGADGPQLWRDADAAMYCAKRAGGGQWVRVSREISNQASEANEIESALRRALRGGDLLLAYQPQVTATNELHSLEALVRFRDPLLAVSPADRVIAIAEESGLIVPLGDWVLEEVCRQSREWVDEALRPIQIALNVSPLQLTRSNFALKVASALERYQLSPRMLEMEVTESTMMPDRGEAPEQIATLARMGVRFSVDDFGKGYSSLGRLHQLPVDSLKIDCSFTRRIAEKKGTYPTVRAIVALAHTLGMNVVAEGVETEEQLRILRSLDCDRMQGYLFSKPLLAGDVKAFLQEAGYSWMQAEVA